MSTPIPLGYDRAALRRLTGGRAGIASARQSSTMHPSMGFIPAEGCRLLREVKLSRRHYHRVLRPHTPSHPRRPRRPSASHHKHAIKRATMRDRSRRCVYCAEPLEFATATLDHVYPAHGGAHTAGGSLSPLAHGAIG